MNNDPLFPSTLNSRRRNRRSCIVQQGLRTDQILDAMTWLGLTWDEQYRQSERLALHKRVAESILAKGLAYRDFTPPNTGGAEKDDAQGCSGAQSA